MLRIGMIVDSRYKVLREIGRGGTSCVYLAENIRLHNYLAIKEVYKSGLTTEGSKSNMFISESSILTKLRHPGLPSIIDIINTAQSYLIVMEYIEGVSLDKVILQNGSCSEKDVLKWGKQLCDVLEYLHSQHPPIIYRDMKPANIMLKPNGDIVLIDFGLAREYKKLNQHDTTYLGTHGYAAPEQYSNEKQSDTRTDIYSLGVTLYHLISGNDPCLPPYGVNPIGSDKSSMSFDRVIQKCTQLRPELRYQSAGELKNALDSVIPDELVYSESEDSGRNNKWLWSLAIIPVVIILVIIAVVLGTRNSGKGINETYKDYGVSPDKSFSDGVSLYFEQEVHITKPDEREYFTFTPEKTGYYSIYSVSGDGLPIVWLSDENDNLVDKDNTKGEYTEFSLYCWLYEGDTYFIETTLYDMDPNSPATGIFWIYVEYSE